ncbi:MAG: ABC transporter substrate-binding protein [Firmicutes bacterium]|nr:ABC transporter substrate-binding protein [Bacillota bacterium]
MVCQRFRISVRAFVVVVVVTLSLVAWAAQGILGASKITISFHSWMAAEKTSGGVGVLEYAEKLYEKEHPNIDINTVPLPYEETLNQFTVMSAAGNAPDITLIDVAWLAQIAAMGNVETLDEYLPKSMVDDMFPSTLAEGRIRGKLYALPWNQNPNCMVYNKTLMKKAGLDPETAPRTMDELDKAIAAIGNLGPDIQGIALNGTLDAFSADYLHPWLWNFGGEVLDTKGNVIINQEGGVKTFKWLKNLVDKKYMKAGLGIREIRVLFAQEKVGFMLEGPWIKGILENLSEKGTEFNKEWAMVPIPKGPAIKGEYGYANPSSHMLVLSKASKHKKEAFDYMKFLVTDPRVTRDYFANTGLMPILKSQLMSWSEFKSPFAQAALLQMQYTRIPNAWGPKWQGLGTAIMKATQKVLMENADVITTLNALAKELQRMLKQ